MLISNCAVIERTLTGRGGKLKAPVVKLKSFELERKGEKNLQADRKIGQMSNPSLRWRGKIEQWIRISARKRPRGPGLLKQQCPALTSSIESYDKHLKKPQKRRNRPNGPQESGKVSSFT